VEAKPTVKLSGWIRCRTLATIGRILAFCAIGAASAGCSRGTPVTVINRSHVPLENVVLSGSGFSESIGSVGPNAQLRVLVRPDGESGLAIRFNAGGQSVSYGPEGYFEGGGGYTVIAIVSPSLAVSVKSERAY
jgi:hypothetical protein